MATEKQRRAARRNIRKAQKAWQNASPRKRARTQPQGRNRSKPGSSGGGKYYHVEVRPKSGFVTFRTQDVGKPGGMQRVAGKRRSGSWDTQKWLIGKESAHVEHGRLVGDKRDARRILDSLGSTPHRISGDRFRAKPRPNVPEYKKPTPAQRRAQRSNIKKAQQERWG